MLIDTRAEKKAYQLGIMSGLLVFLALFFLKFDKENESIRGVSIRA